ncbi:class I SAM-dependent methyltransferase [Pseudonocardia sp. GCM10023141]|uniref:class I SAM-dependent methyltransferase n=1 Tax=Pseudonocardia sp. GCM10023141 TaxID=3252653 RepID=UPI0036149125
MAEKVALTGAAATMLGTLYGRAVDARSRHPLLADPTAVDVLDRIDYDFASLKIAASSAVGVALRAKRLDGWTRAFLAAHPAATVLHLGCGLDSRVQRIDPPPEVRWFDVDQPQVIELRQRLYAPRSGGYTTIGASVLDPGWLAQVPRGGPAIVVAEGLTMYLPTVEGPALLRRLVEHLGTGELAFDTYSTLAVRLTRRMPILRATGARLDWGVDDPAALAGAVPGLRLAERVGQFAAAAPDDLRRAPLSYRLECAVLGRLPWLRDIGDLLRYTFAPGG